MPNPEQNLGFADINSGLPNQGNPNHEIQNPTTDPENFSGQPIVESENSVSFVGVELPKENGGSHVPSRERFKNIEKTLTSDDLRQMQKIAVALKLRQPILMEEYSGSGKTTKVEHMCSLLNADVYYANCHDFDADVLIGKTSTDESTKSGFGWQDGLVMQAIRNGGILFLDEYNFMRGEVRARMHEILDALLNGKESVSLIENNHEIVPVSPNLRIVAAQNPPGGEFGNREVLDPAQYSRFAQIKGPSRMSKETKLARALGYINRDNEVTIESGEYFISEANLSPDQLEQIPGIEEIIRKYVEFEETFQGMVENRQIGADQPQPIYLAFERDKTRVYQFVQMFYNGDINETFQKALRYYYSNRLESSEDRAKIEELIKHVEYTPPVDSRRRTIGQAETPEAETSESVLKAKAERELDSVLSSPDIPDSVKSALKGREKLISPDDWAEAKEIMGTDFIGPAEIQAVFGLESVEVPPIPFSKEELERAKELNQMLILRQPMTMEQINDRLGGKVKDGSKLLDSFDETSGKLKDDAWFKDEKFYKEEIIDSKWALVSKELISESTSKKYLEQTDAVVGYLQNQVFSGGAMPVEFQTAIDEYNGLRSEIETTMSTDWKRASSLIEALQITQRTRQTPAEAIYDLAVYYQSTGERLLPGEYTWTRRRDSSGFLVFVGHFDAGGVNVSGYGPATSYGFLGVSFSRSL